MKIVAVSASALVHEQQRYRGAGFDAFIAKPFRFEQLCECMANLLHGVWTQTVVESGSTAPLAEPLALPEDLLSRTKEAAELYSTTTLRNCLNDIEQLGSAGRQLVERLRPLLENYDMDGILEILSEVE